MTDTKNSSNASLHITLLVNALTMGIPTLIVYNDLPPKNIGETLFLTIFAIGLIQLSAQLLLLLPFYVFRCRKQKRPYAFPLMSWVTFSLIAASGHLYGLLMMLAYSG